MTVLEKNPGSPEPTSVLSTTDQLNAEQTVTQIANSPFVRLAKEVLKVGWWLAAQKNFSMIGGPDKENMAQLDQAITEYANQAAMEVLLLNSNAPRFFQQVAPSHNWYLQNFTGTRIWYDNPPDTIYRFVGVNNASSYVITGKFDGTLPADTNFSVLTGLNGDTADNINGKDLVLNADGSFTITVDSTPPTAPGQTNHLYLPPGGTSLITTRNTLADWNTEEPMSLSILRVSGPPNSLFSQVGGFAIPVIGPLVSGNPLLTSLVSIIPPLPAPRLLQSVEAAVIMLLLGISGEDKYMGVATKDATTGQTKAPNVFSDPDHNASFLATQLQSVGYFQLADDEALVLTIDPGKARYFSVPVTNDWTITNNYWDEQTSLNVSQSIEKNPDGTYTIVVSPQRSDGVQLGVHRRSESGHDLHPVPGLRSVVHRRPPHGELPGGEDRRPRDGAAGRHGLRHPPGPASRSDRRTPTGIQPAVHALPAGLEIEQRRIRRLDQPAQVGQERRGLRPPSAMRWSNAHVKRHRRPGHHRAVDHDGPRLQRPPHPENRGLRVIDHRHTLIQAQRTEVRHRERRPAQLVGRQRARPARRMTSSTSAAKRRVEHPRVSTTGTTRPRSVATATPSRTSGCSRISGPPFGFHPGGVEYRMPAQRDHQQPQRQHKGRHVELITKPKQRRAIDLHAGVCIRNSAARQRHMGGHPGVHATHRDVL